MGTRVLALLLVLLVVPVAGAATLTLESTSVLLQETGTTLQEATFEYRVAFGLDEPRSVYLKVLPASSNPVHRNGTVNVSGWWTDIFLMQGDTRREVGATNGTDIVDFGSLGPGSHVAILAVHAPVGSLRHPLEYRMSYALAERAPATGQGSGGTLDPSLSVLPRLVVRPADNPTVGGEGETEPATPITTRGTLILLATLALVVLSVLAVRRLRARGPPKEPSP